MFECFIRIAAAGLLSLAFGSAYCFTMEDRWSIRELYSSADGSIQFIVLEYVFGSGANYNFAGQTLFSADRTGTQTRSIAVLTEPPPCVFCDVDGAVVTYLIATHGFADLRVATPNLIVPNGF